MAFRHFVLTLTGVAQRLSDVYGDGVGVVLAGSNIPYRQVIFSADPANGSAIYVGADNTVSSTDHAFSLDPTQASQKPFSLGPFDTGPVKLSDLWVVGANNERLMLGGVPF